MSTAKRSQRAPHQLPAGRHGLARSFVVRNQRERILSAVAESVGAAGYAATTVEDVIARAGVSRRTFYDHFSNKEEAFLAAYDEAMAQLRAIIEEAFAGAGEFAAGVRDCLTALAETLANEPAFASMCIVEVLAAGPPALQRRNAAMAWFTELIQRGATEGLRKGDRPPPLAAETVVGGLYEVFYSRILRGETSELPALVPDLVHSTLLPYVGPERAAKERTAAKRRRARR